MRQKRFNLDQIAEILDEAEVGFSNKEVCVARRYRSTRFTPHHKHGDMPLSKAKRAKVRKEEN
jgi:hypothetical protein